MNRLWYDLGPTTTTTTTTIIIIITTKTYSLKYLMLRDEGAWEQGKKCKSSQEEE